MTGRKKWFCFSLVLLCGLALSLAMFAGGNGPGPVRADQKMPLLLKQLSDLYRDLGVQKLTRDILSQKKLQALSGQRALKQESMELLDSLLGNPDLTDEIVKRGPKKDKAPMDQFLDPVLQQRWGNPPFDVGCGVISSASDPRALESSYLKIRKTWRKADSWKAFCEFAIFKAEEIVADATITYLGLSPKPELNNDLGSMSTGAPRLRVGSPANYDGNVGYTGQGVIVGDVDSGVDFAHGDFLDANGNSRILFLWDTTVETADKDPQTLFGMSGLDYGTVYTNTEINTGLCPEFDPPSSGGHGTHTLGTAAGNGGATGNYTGMAPNADIIFVKGLDASGIEFIFEMARRLGRPAAVNNSWGISWMSYIAASTASYVTYASGDGSDDYSQYMDYLMGEYPNGSIIVKSAGNGGMWQTYVDHDDYSWAMYNGSLHFGGTSTQGNAVQHTYNRLPHPEYFGIRSEYSDFWIRSDVPVLVTIVTAAQTVTRSTGQSGAFGGAFSNHTNSNLNLTDIYNGEYCGYFLFDEWTADPGWGEGNWTLTVEPLNAGDTVHYDVWLKSNLIRWYNAGHTGAYNNYDSCFTTNSSHSEYQLDWSSSPDAITAGAWTTRSEWLGADGYWHYPWDFLEPQLNTITYFSSPGPARDGRMKPDIAAPGAAIISALAGNLSAGIPDSEKDPDMQHQWMWGTSMAAPHATGACALILQKNPNLSLSSVRNLLTNWANNDANTQAIGPNGFGAGKLNILPLNDPPVAVISVDKPSLVLDNNEVATFNGSGSHDRENFPLTYAWRLVSTPAGAAATLTPAGTKATLKPDPNLEGTYQVGLVVNDSLIDSAMAVAAVVAKFYPVLPPANAQLQHLENNFIFYKEYVNKLTWQANPENKSTITNYKLYKKVKGAADGSYALVSALPPSTFSYEDKGLKKDQLFTYKLTSLNSRGKESDPIVVSN